MLTSLASILLGLSLVALWGTGSLAPFPAGTPSASLVTVTVLWTGLSSTLLALAYLAKRAGAEPEAALDDAPALAAAAALALLPHTLLVLAVVLVERLVAGERTADEVAPRIWVGALPMPWDRSLFRTAGITDVLDMTTEFGPWSSLWVGGRGWRRIPVLDATCPGPDRLDQAVAWCRAVKDRGGTVLVHCAHGHGRSALVAAAAVLAGSPTSSPGEVETSLREARPWIRLSGAQRAALEAYAARLASRPDPSGRPSPRLDPSVVAPSSDPRSGATAPSSSGPPDPASS